MESQSLDTRYILFLNPKVMDIFSHMFDDMWINKDYDGDTLM